MIVRIHSSPWRLARQAAMDWSVNEVICLPPVAEKRAKNGRNEIFSPITAVRGNNASSWKRLLSLGQDLRGIPPHHYRRGVNPLGVGANDGGPYTYAKSTP